MARSGLVSFYTHWVIGKVIAGKGMGKDKVGAWNAIYLLLGMKNGNVTVEIAGLFLKGLSPEFLL